MEYSLDEQRYFHCTQDAIGTHVCSQVCATPFRGADVTANSRPIAPTGVLRVFYEIGAEAPKTVRILAVGKK